MPNDRKEKTMVLAYNDKTGMWEAYEEPYAVVEFPTEDDYNRFLEMVEFFKSRHEEADCGAKMEVEHE